MRCPTLVTRGAAALFAISAVSLQAAPAPATTRQSTDEVMTVAKEFLHRYLARTAGASGEPTITIKTPRLASLPQCKKLIPSFATGMRIRPHVTVTVKCEAPQNWTAYVQASVSVPVTYYVAARALAPGQVLAATDIAALRGDLNSLPAGAVTQRSKLVGMRISQRIAAGRPIAMRSLSDPETVKRGQRVRIVGRGPGFEISNEGEALGTAGPGAPVQVRTASGQTLTGTVRKQGRVEISL
jgi:flagella basal body P-ring formation protein FlgA